MHFPVTVRVRQHLSLFWQYYVAGACVLAFMAIGLAWFSYRDEKHAEIALWPVATATIQSAQVRQINTTSSSGPSWSVNVDLMLSFTVNDHPITARYVGSFSRTEGSEYASTLKEGKDIQIRYNPRKLTIVSLYPCLY